MAIARNVSTEDDTAAAREHSAVGLDSWTFPVFTNMKQMRNKKEILHVNHEVLDSV